LVEDCIFINYIVVNNFLEEVAQLNDIPNFLFNLIKLKNLEVIVIINNLFEGYYLICGTLTFYPHHLKFELAI